MDIKQIAIIFFVSLIVTSLWFYFGSAAALKLVGGNTGVFFVGFIIAYGTFMYYLNQDKLPASFDDLRRLLALILALIIFDLLFYPYLITQQGLPQLPEEAQISSDVLIYRALPILPEEIKYFIVYPLAFSIGILLVYILLPKKQHFEATLQQAL